MSVTIGEHSVPFASLQTEPLHLPPSTPASSSSVKIDAVVDIALDGDQALQASRANAPITTKENGTPRVIVLKHYWDKGFWTGVYYLIQYIFMSSDKQKIMNEIYEAVDEAIDDDVLAEVDIEVLANTIFDNTEISLGVKAELFQKSLAMVAHALGDIKLADDLVSRLADLVGEQEAQEYADTHPIR